MRGFLLLFRRDLQQRWMLFVASLAMGIFIAAIPLLKGSRLSPAELRGAAGLTAALIWCAVLAILLGGSIFTRDLTENRLAFDFRLPVRPSAIWAARLLAAIVTIAFAAGLLLAPPAAAGMDWTGAAAGLDTLLGLEPAGVGAPARSYLALVPVAALATLLLANPAALAARARQSWAGVDLFSVGMVSFAAISGWQLLELWDARMAQWRMSVLVVTLTILGAIVASFVQISRGRTEPDRAQQSLSLTLFAAALATGSAALVYANWYVRPPLSSLAANRVFVESLGPNWVSLLGGTTRDPDFPARFLMHPASGRALHLGPVDPHMDSGNVQGSRDGSRAAWLEWDSSRTPPRLRLKVLELSSQQSYPTTTGITFEPPARSWAISPRGDAVASLQQSGAGMAPRRLVVERIDSATIEFSALLPDCKSDGPLLFLNRNQLLAACGENSGGYYPDQTQGVFHIDLPSRVVRSYETSFQSARPWVWRFDHRTPRPWDFAERDSAFEGPQAIDAVSRDSSRRWQWFDPESKTLKPLLKEDQYPTGLRSFY